MSKKQLKDFITHEQNRLDKERAQRFEDLGYKPLMTFDVGTTKIKLLPIMPRPFKSSWGQRVAFRIEYNGQKQTGQ
jgi:1,4-alpha-glucan branching enzyme